MKKKVVIGSCVGAMVLLAVLTAVFFLTENHQKKQNTNIEAMAEADSEQPETHETEAADDTEAAAETEETEEIRMEHPLVRGIYVTGPAAGSERMDELIAMLDETELNTMVIDVKNDDGEITYKMDSPTVNAMGNGVAYIGDMEALMQTLKEHEIHTIARIICFKDPYFAENYPECALTLSDGTKVVDGYGLAWVNPYRKEVWDYLTEIALAAAEIGFDEVQFDYVRFPIGDEADAADYGVDMEAYPKEQAISDFLKTVCEKLHEKNVTVSADVFGTVIGSQTDIMRVGQNYAALGETVDVLSPMVYPSHYAAGTFGNDVPDACPYETVAGALALSVQELKDVPEERRAAVRPWLQAFTASWVDGFISYGEEEIRQQVQAVYDAGYEEWILWNSASSYVAE